MALRDVNMVPDEVLNRRYAGRHLAAWGVCYLLTLGFAAAGYATYVRTSVAQHPPAMDEQQVRRQLASTIIGIQQKKDDLERLALARRVAGVATAPRALTRLAEIMDPAMWLTDLTFQAGKETRAGLLFNGRSVSHARLGAFVRQLGGDRMFRNVALRNATQLQGSSAANEPSNTVQFTVSADIVGD